MTAPERVLPALQVRIGGVEHRGAASVSAVRVARRLSAPAQCELTLTGADVAEALSGWVALGEEIDIGIVGEERDLFSGAITAAGISYATDGSCDVRVRGYDSLHRLRNRSAARTFSDVSTAELVATVAADAGLGFDARAEGPRWPLVVQHGESDLDLLVAVCRRSGLALVADGDTVVVIDATGTGHVAELRLGSELHEVHVEANSVRSAAGFEARGWAPDTNERFTASVASARTGRDVSGLGDRPDGPARLLADVAGWSGAHGEAVAQRWFDDTWGSDVVLSGVADGDATLRAGTRVRIGGVAPPFAGSYVLAATTHTVDAAGYRVLLSTELPALSAPGPAASVAPPAGSPVQATLGIVVDVDDPMARGRLRVNLPTHGDVETTWCQVVVPGAGDRRGAWFLPDVGDEVLVMLLGGDPAAAVVLGGLLGSASTPRASVAGGRTRRWGITTAEGQAVTLDDEGRAVRVEAADGSALELGPERALLHAVTDLRIEAPGRTITIAASAVDFEQAQS